MKRLLVALSMLLLLALCGQLGVTAFDFTVSPAFASGKDDDDDDNDSGKYDKLRDAVIQKRILPLSQVKAKVIERFGANIIDIDIDRKSGKWIYEFKVINDASHILEIYVDASNGTIIKVEND